MAQESVRSMTDTVGERTNRVGLAAQDLAERAGAYAQERATRIAEAAQALAADANERLKEYTGRPLEAWTADARAYARAHPLQVVAATIGIGYILGKIMKRGA
jgi:ElaB/YqjD/DUF883 family membrane-anchored ribosome-binding protein